jgi:hypothetical protein
MNALIIFDKKGDRDILHYYGIKKITFGKNSLILRLNKNYETNDSEKDVIEKYRIIRELELIHEYRLKDIDKFMILED